MQVTLAAKKEKKKGRPVAGAEPSADPAGAAAGVPLFLQRSPLSAADPGSFLPRLMVGPADDVHEKEAEGVAREATQGPCPKCAAGAPCPKCAAAAGRGAAREEEVVRAQRLPGAAGAGGPAPPGVRAADSGEGLSQRVRDQVESVLGVDLGHVRVHTGPAAQSAAKQLHAKAFTHQAHIWLGAGQSPEDVGLMAHEAAHVVQQGAGAASPHLVQRAPAEEGVHDGEVVRARLQGTIDRELGREPGETPLPAAPAPGPKGAAPPPGPKGTVPSGATAAAHPEARKSAAGVDRAELAEKEGQLRPVARPPVDRAAQQQPRVDRAAGAVKQEVDSPPKPQGAEEAGAAKGKKGGKEAAGEGGAAGAADQAAGLAERAFALADAQPTPIAPPDLIPPEPVQPVDAAGLPLDPDPEADFQALELADKAQELREQGYLLRARASVHRANAGVLRGNLGLVQQGIRQAEDGVQTAEGHLEYRRGVVEQSRQALAVSEQKAATVAEQAPGYVEKADEGKSKSGPLASESKELAAENAANTPDDEDAAADAQEQGGKLNQVSSDSSTVDNAITQAQSAAGTLVQDAAKAKETNARAGGKIEATQAILDQTGERLGEMRGQNAQARGQVENLMDQPAQMTALADDLDAQGAALIQASADMEAQLQAVQQDFATGMKSVPAPRPAEPEGESPGEEVQVQRAPAEAAPEEPKAVNLAEGLPSWLTGEDEPSAKERAEAQTREQERRRRQLAMIDEASGGNFQNLDAGQKMDLAVRMMGQNLFGSVSKISWPGWGGLARGAGKLAAGLIDPRAPLMGVVGGLNMIINGFRSASLKHPWTILKAAADIATGLTIILGSITALAGVIAAIMTAITILSFGTAAPVTGPIIAFCATVMSTVGGWTLWVGAIALLLQELVFIKNLYEAATAQTSEELLKQGDNLTQDVGNAGNVVMQMGMAKLAQVGGRGLQAEIAEAGGGVRFAARMGAKGLPARVAAGAKEAGGVRAFAGGVARSTGRGVSGAVKRLGAAVEKEGLGGVTRKAVSGAWGGVKGTARGVWKGLTEEAPAATGPGGLSREFLVGKDIPPGGLRAAAGEARAAARAEVVADMRARGVLPPAREPVVPAGEAAGVRPPGEAPAVKPAEPPAVTAGERPAAKPTEPSQRTTHLDQPEVEKGVVAKQPTGDGHEVKVTRDGRCERCSPDCPELRVKYKEDLQANPKMQQRLNAIEKEPNPKLKAEKAAQLDNDLRSARAKAEEELAGLKKLEEKTQKAAADRKSFEEAADKARQAKVESREAATAAQEGKQAAEAKVGEARARAAQAEAKTKAAGKTPEEAALAEQEAKEAREALARAENELVRSRQALTDANRALAKAKGAAKEAEELEDLARAEVRAARLEETAAKQQRISKQIEDLKAQREANGAEVRRLQDQLDEARRARSEAQSNYNRTRGEGELKRQAADRLAAAMKREEELAARLKPRLEKLDELDDKLRTQLQKRQAELRAEQEAGKVMTPEFKQQLRDSTPRESVRKQVLEDPGQLRNEKGEFIDVVSREKIPPGEVSVEHVYPVEKIMAREDFQRLTEKQMKEVLDLRENLMVLKKSVNSAKGDLSMREFFSTPTGQKIDGWTRVALLAKEQQAEAAIIKAIQVRLGK